MKGDYWTLVGPFGLRVRVAIRLAQFVLAIITLGIVAADFSASTTKTDHIYAFVVTVLSILTDALHCLATLESRGWLVLDFLLVVLWAAAAGTLGSTAFDGYEGKEKDEGVLSTERSQMLLAAMIFAILSMGFWLASCFHGCVWCCTQRRQRKATKRALEEDTHEMELNNR
ncbi:uncharacterized protein B0J16DRAFT_147319 [Fusarium flagelliforme]|uniref:Sterol glucosyltransferase n=1 Tax=Fusarium flagelliforme TaxID=2675880 RepID=A0A395M4D9_9HYPO|nr:uncharacterized protein B0J16DRAFT_147319 [Fusarium flagelliforme]KAH7182254.1 hypothetical protein B0J16DRAFT_147319 [Fusarium flagelliforme]RFN40708.1 sterol glucosyltransferase [Fusarium flagelliforme]